MVFIEVLEDRFDEKACIAERSLLLNATLAGPAALAETDVEPTVGFEQIHRTAQEEPEPSQWPPA